MNVLKGKLLAESLVDDQDLERNLQEVFTLFTDDPNDLAGHWEALFREPPMYDVDRYFHHEVYDYRFRCLLLNNYRKYGHPKRDAAHFGIPFYKVNNNPYEEVPQSVFVLGNNGLGKSSLFDAMEQICTGKISEATYRGISDLQWYVNRNIGEAPDIRLYTCFDKDNYIGVSSSDFLETGIDAHGFFLSENSIYELSRFMQTDGKTGDVDWLPCFCYALGLEDILYFVEDSTGYYQALIDRIKEVNQMISNDPQKQRDNLERLIRDTSVVLTDKELDIVFICSEELGKIIEELPKFDIYSLYEKVWKITPAGLEHLYSMKIFKERLENVGVKIDLLRKQSALGTGSSVARKKIRTESYNADTIRFELKTIIEELHYSLETTKELRNVKSLPLDRIIHETETLLSSQKTLMHSKEAKMFEGLPERLTQFRNNLKENLEQQFKSFFDDAFRTVIKNTFVPFLAEGEKLDFVDMPHGVVVDDYGLKVTVNDIPINKYFNTFRFRLFCLSMMVAFNLKMMNLMKFRFPFVFDDVFYANDYRNKHELFSFFHVLADNAKALLGDKNAVQVIFFTHDEQFVNTLLQKKMPFSNYSVSRLMEPEFLPSPYVSKCIDKINDVPFCNVVNEFKRFKDEKL